MTTEHDVTGATVYVVTVYNARRGSFVFGVYATRAEAEAVQRDYGGAPPRVHGAGVRGWLITEHEVGR